MQTQNKPCEPVFCYACGRRYVNLERRCPYCHVGASDDLLKKAVSVWQHVCGSMFTELDQEDPQVWSEDDERTKVALAIVNALGSSPTWVEIVETLGIFPDKQNEVLTPSQFRKSTYAVLSTEELLVWFSRIKFSVPELLAHLAYRLGNLRCIVLENYQLECKKTETLILDTLLRIAGYAYLPKPEAEAITFLEAMSFLIAPREVVLSTQQSARA